ncbi:hypothetical protein [Allorhodopirellula solitaria]|uniref:hypothetical protein n=1 Tax=Allorhodopirellula solitaria TaxID=2527987 RepID=UPI001648360A|nr:hypothetical protein [Allorhodopirellula solitaria]
MNAPVQRGPREQRSNAGVTNGPSGFVVGNSSVLDFRGMAVASEMSDAVTE